MTKKKYSFADHPEHKELLPVYRDKWIANAMSTKPMDDTERKICRESVKAMYAAANLTPPPDHRIVFVSSPFVMRFAAGFASAIWWLRKNPNNKLNSNAATRDATRDATYAATRDATDAATRAATDDATRAATDDATRDATRDATYAATRAATRAATDDATDDATDAATDAATDDATRDATRDATYAATRDATDAATRAATDDATRAATRAATYAATDDATRDATRDATYAATRDATYAATRDATDAATRAATDDATRAATRDATYAATEAATYAATDDATRDATRAATRAATDDATDDATDAATDDATRDATRDALKPKNKKTWFSLDINIMVNLSNFFGLKKFGLSCSVDAYRMYQGGNQWSGWHSYLNFFREVSKLPIDYTKYDAVEQLAIHSGPRIVHTDFCIISDRPSVLKVDEQNRPHCENGPFCQWRDGIGLYAWHGVRVPMEWIEDRSTLTPEIALKCENLEQRRAAIEMIGWDNVLNILPTKIIDENPNPEIGTLLEVDLPDAGKEKFLRVKCGTGRFFSLCVPPSVKTAQEASAWTYFLDEKQYSPEIRT